MCYNQAVNSGRQNTAQPQRATRAWTYKDERNAQSELETTNDGMHICRKDPLGNVLTNPMNRLPINIHVFTFLNPQ